MTHRQVGFMVWTGDPEHLHAETFATTPEEAWRLFWKDLEGVALATIVGVHAVTITYDVPDYVEPIEPPPVDLTGYRPDLP